MVKEPVCESCRAVVTEGKTGCRKLFEDVLVKDYSDYRYAKTHRLMVDAYSLQHPEEYMLSGKSFAAHLTGMYVALEGEESSNANRTVQKWLSGNPQIDKPVALPKERGDIKITYVHSATGAEEHQSRVREWANSVWSAWSEYHDLAKLLISEATAKTNKS
ncbi:MAG: DUF5946 family protein [Acidobacteriota bacterium]|nr:DUF5946 family protein [Acidobacteriota bacterium]